MDEETIRAKMMEEVVRVQDSAMTEAFNWITEVDGLNVYTTIQHRQKSEIKFLLKTNFEEFPRLAPSYLFVDISTKELTDDAWPRSIKWTNNKDIGICIQGTREFYEIIHPNDARYPWDPEKFTFLGTLQQIHLLVEHEYS